MIARHWGTSRVFAAGAMALLLGGCAGGYIEGGPDVNIGLDFFEPLGFDYGGWGPGYRVGPMRGGEPRGGDGRAHSYRPAAPSRSTPSIPGGGRGSGGHGAGGQHR